MDHRARGHLGLARVRLFDQLDAATAAGPVLVLAPAGFGKTTLLAQYARRHPGPAAAYQADAMEVAHGDTAARLVEAVLAARRTRPEPGGVPGTPDLPAAEAARTWSDARRLVAEARDESSAVLEAMADAALDPGGLLLTLDDIHHLIGTPGEQVVARVLARRPRDVQIVLAARRPPGLPLLRHELAGDGGLVGLDDLRFRRWEVERLLDEVYGEPLPPEETALLARRTGGWPAGLALFHRAIRGRPMADRCRAAGAPLERWPAFRQFFDESVLAGLPADILDLLVRTCVLDVLTPDRCARLTGAPVAAATLDGLIGTYALPMTAHGDSYRYEPPFRAHLAQLLGEQLGPVGLREWHRRSAEVLLDEDAPAEAARSLARAADWPALQLLLAEHGPTVVRPPAADLLELVPEAQRADEPWLIYAEAEHHLNNAQLPEARDRFRAAEAMFASRADVCGEVGVLAARSQLGEVESLLAVSLPPRGLHWTAWLRVAVGPNAVQNTRRVTELTPAEAELIRLVGAIYGGGVPDEITRETHTVGIDARDSAVALLGLRLVRTCLAVARGKASPAALERIADEAEMLGLGWVARLALGARALGRGPYTAVDAYAVAAACRRAGDRWGHLLVTSVGVICEVRDGRLDEERLAALAAEATEMNAESIAAWADAFCALARARRGAPEAAREGQAAIDRAEAARVSGAVVAGMLAVAVADPLRREVLLRAAADRAAEAELPRTTFKFWVATYAAGATANPAPAVQIRCFGGFAMAVSGRPVDLAQVRPRARSALRLLAMHAGRFVHREVLIEALWSDLPPAAATRNLQVTISALRGLLEPDSGRGKAQMLLRSGDAYGIVLPAGSYADTAAFTEAVQRWQQQRRSGSFASEVDAMRAALAAYGGELLPEEGPAEWAVEAREQYRHLATRVARELATAELTQGNVAEAIRAAEQCIALDPHDDEAWQVLLRAYARSATPAKALEARRRYADMLARLGVPEPTQQQLHGGNAAMVPPPPRRRAPRDS
ncbi:BTAD domain-containing putative transcriptional regulator [Krasilnikovia sp. MM14-A1004]|uniref:BTAD domain-containing putative transcriptional regulator n=1 Tax=Krasilnikovia sp. MM14-A1004 TaxID=3373541 RepID=UPI00399C98F3